MRKIPTRQTNCFMRICGLKVLLPIHNDTCTAGAYHILCRDFKLFMNLCQVDSDVKLASDATASVGQRRQLTVSNSKHDKAIMLQNICYTYRHCARIFYPSRKSLIIGIRSYSPKIAPMYGMPRAT